MKKYIKVEMVDGSEIFLAEDTDIEKCDQNDLFRLAIQSENISAIDVDEIEYVEEISEEYYLENMVHVSK